jgi:hypothetical protein
MISEAPKRHASVSDLGPLSGYLRYDKRFWHAILFGDGLRDALDSAFEELRLKE